MKESRTTIGQHNLASIAALAVFVAASFVPAVFGAQFRPGPWYDGLVKPALNPPGWIFGPIWTFLYLTMGMSAWLVWRHRRRRPVGRALILFAIQFVLNGLWSYLFFGLKDPGLAFLDIVILWAAIICILVLFWQKSRPAGLLLMPYLLWVSFAVYLNFAIWRLNPI